MFRIITQKETSDEDAMRKFRNGDAGSFDMLLKRHGAAVLRFVMKMTGSDRARAEDLLQEIFMKVIERRERYDPGQKFSTWLYAIARNHCIDFLRTESYRRHKSLDAPLLRGEEGGTTVLEIVRGEGRDPEQQVYDRELGELIKIGVEGLKQDFREVFLLREVEGLSFQEIADITESPLGTVKSRLRYAYKNLREVFAQSGYFEKKQKIKEG